jgi:hypothetical protein
LTARIVSLENVSGGEPPPEVASLYRDLEQEFEPARLGDYVVLKLARRLRSRDRIEEAGALYQDLVQRTPASAHAGPARLEFARLLLLTGGDEGRKRAPDLLEGVLSLTHPGTPRESAHLELARLHTEDEDWGAAADSWQSYLDRSEWTRARAEANYSLALCRDRLGETEEALRLYANTYVGYEGHTDWSSRAFVRSAIIRWERGDREGGLAVLNDMLDRMGDVSHPVVNRARTLRERWRREATSS